MQIPISHNLSSPLKWIKIKMVKLYILVKVIQVFMHSMYWRNWCVIENVVIVPPYIGKGHSYLLIR